MRILYVVSELTYGGAQKQLVELSKELVRRGHEVAIYTLNRDVPRAVELKSCTVELFVDQKQAKLDLGVLCRLRRKIKAWQPDLVHGFLFDGDFYSRLSAFGTKVPVLNSERNDNYSLAFNQKVAHWLTRKLADAVVANSHSGKSFAEKLFSFPPERVHVVWNGLNLKDLRERIEKSVENYPLQFFGSNTIKVACLVGAIKPSKDFFLALHVASELTQRDSSWRVLLIGDQLSAPKLYAAGSNSDTTHYKNEVMSEYARLKHQDRVRFIGLRTDVVEIMSQCNVLFSTSVHEGFPNVVLEAMGIGLPVVSTAYSDIARILPNPWQVINSRLEIDFVNAIVRAHENRAFLAEQQIRWVEQHATIEHAADELLAVYQHYVDPIKPHSLIAQP